MKTVRMALAVVFVLGMAASLMAQDAPKGGEGRGRRGPGMGMMGMDRFAMFERMSDLSAEQKEKLETLKKEYNPKLAAMREKVDAILTAEQKKARDEAMKLTGGERFTGLRKALGTITEEQKKKFADLNKEMEPVNKELQEKMMSILTAEQKEKLKQMRERFGKRGEGKKSEEKKSEEKK
jgi:Spy/CpxP family protein refolding chaperone